MSHHAIISGGTVVGLSTTPRADGLPISEDMYRAILTDPDGLDAWAVVDGEVARVGRVIPLAARVTAGIAEVRRIAQSAADSLIGGYPDYERATWDDQSNEADAYLAWYDAGRIGDAPETPVLVTIANDRGITVQEISLRVQANRAAYKFAGAALVARRQAAEDQLAAVTDAAEIEPIIQSVRDLADQITSSQES